MFDYNSYIMSGSLYLHTGMLTIKSVQFVDALRQNGWRSDYLDMLKGDLVRFESASIVDDYDDAAEVLVHDHPAAIIEFLKSLNRHIKALARAERYEELHNKARTNSKDSIAANVILSQTSKKSMDLSSIKKSNVRLDKLAAMSKEDLEREVSEVQKRLTIDVRTSTAP